MLVINYWATNDIPNGRIFWHKHPLDDDFLSSEYYLFRFTLEIFMENDRPEKVIWLDGEMVNYHHSSR